MPEQEWGTKRLCPSCTTRFYDLNNDPTTCPNCGTVHELSAFTLTKAKGARAEAAKKEKAKAAAAEDVVDDVLDDDDDDDADLDTDDTTVLDDDDDDSSIGEIAEKAKDNDDD